MGGSPLKKNIALPLSAIFTLSVLLTGFSGIQNTVSASEISPRCAQEYLRIIDEISAQCTITDRLSEEENSNSMTVHDDMLPASLVDVCADSTPELILVTDAGRQSDNSAQTADSENAAASSEDINSPCLTVFVYTYNGFNAAEIFRQPLDNEHTHYCLFQNGEDKNLWLYSDNRPELEDWCYTQYTYLNDIFQIAGYLLHKPGDICVEDDVQISAETFSSKEAVLVSDITNLLQWNSIPTESGPMTGKTGELSSCAQTVEDVKAVLLPISAQS